MGKMLYGMIVVFVLSSAFGFVMETSFARYESEFQWRLKNVNDLPDRYKSLHIPKVPIPIFSGLIILKTDTYNILDKISLENMSHGEPVNVNGTILFKNSTNHVLHEAVFEKKNIHAYSETDIWTMSPPRFQRDFRTPDNTLVLDFSVTFTGIMTKFVDQ